MGSSAWLPTWLQAVAVAVFVVVVLVHGRHVVAMSGRARLWHAAHVLMAVGMVNMYWPSSMPVGYQTGEVVFAVAAAATLGFVGVDLARSGPPVWLGLVTALDLSAMVYMFEMMRTTWQWLTVVLVVWYAVETVLWQSGLLSRLAWHSGLGLPVRPTSARQTAREAPSASGDQGGVAVASRRVVTEPTASPGRADPVFGRPLRITLSVMAVGMGYMFLVMQWGMPSMGMPAGNGGMPATMGHHAHASGGGQGGSARGTRSGGMPSKGDGGMR